MSTTLPTIDWDDTPRVRETDRLTSHAAADSNTNRALVESAVLTLLEREPMTDPELTAAYFRTPGLPTAQIDSPRKRRSDLLGKGMVIATDETRLTPSGRRATVWGVPRALL